ncbi:hypothetical protein [Halococcus salifodinae]|uniref:PIN domain-containing protein n=1 Tax=Halococcus salifodinae DSM 8989 TaxID=1227456 RepID=M0MYK1_9EURY|nr:hypothetical protein [Halococcus salifodinae]EMA50681.1 hypothetical protein C450_13422 [Halococcus salifodinae DSM 8989]
MHILDSNVWIFAFLKSGEAPLDYLYQVYNGEITVRLTPYIVEEVVTNIRHEYGGRLTNEQLDEFLTNFLSFSSNCDHVDSPSQEEIGKIDLLQERAKPHYHLIGETLGIQAKDAPILLSAYQLRRYDPLILTADEEFASLDPSDFESYSGLNPSERNLTSVTIEYLEIDEDITPDRDLPDTN